LSLAIKEDAMSKVSLLCRVALIASVVIAMPAKARDSAIPDFTSASFGWLVSNGFDFLPVEGRLAPVGPDPSWTGGIGLPKADFNHQPSEPGAGPPPPGASRIGPWNIERLSDAENPNLRPWAKLSRLFALAIRDGVARQLPFGRHSRAKSYRYRDGKSRCPSHGHAPPPVVVE
jgi:hypothetical protein